MERKPNIITSGMHGVSGRRSFVPGGSSPKRVPTGISSQRAEEVGKVLELLETHAAMKPRRVVFFQDVDGGIKSNTLRNMKRLGVEIEIREIPFDRLRNFPFQPGDVAIVESNSKDPKHLDSIRETLGKNRVPIFRGLFDGSYRPEIEEIARPIGRTNIPTRSFSRMASRTGFGGRGSI